MSGFGYNHLHEECSPPTQAEPPDNHKHSASKSQYDSLQTKSNETQNAAVLSLSTSCDIRSNSDNVRYTALRPTSVTELLDKDGAESSVNIMLPSCSKKGSISKIYVIICGLLITCVVLMAFGLIYVFIILPSNSDNDRPDPRVQSHDEEQASNDVIVKTSCGRVRGMKEQEAYVFKGIPYSVPPTGSRRWKPPRSRDADPSTCWQGIYNATEFGNKCFQPKFGNTSTSEGSEDCLYVNVWTPSLNPKAFLPVMVWFHSGDFVYGCGHAEGMSPTAQVAKATNFVFVSFNYRLGIFGFLALDEFRQNLDGSSGNFGFMDQQLLLTWVKRNIRAFGGNEKEVTIFGHGSGATSIQAMLLSADSNGLFHKAWLSSPVAILNKTVDQSCRDNKSFMRRSGCSSVQCLRKMPADKLLLLSPWPLEHFWTLQQIFSIPTSSQPRNDLPIFDGHVVRWSSQRSGPDGPRVPIVFGSTYFDFSSLKTEQTFFNMTREEYKSLVDQYVGILGPDAVTRVESLYSETRFYDYTSSAKFPSVQGAQFSHLVGDIKNVCPVKILTDAFVRLYANSTPVYMYVADIFPSYSIDLATIEKNTFIGWDIVTFFDTFQELNFTIGQGELNFQNVLREQITSFVRSGQPDASRWTTADATVGVIGRDVTVLPVTSEYFNMCDFWKEYTFFDYTWDISP